MNANYQPVQRQERVEILDLLRGFALLGIFMVNMPLMNAPFLVEMAEFSLWTDPVNEKARWIIDFFFTGKFYTLFSMLFGIGFYFFMKKADESGNSVLGLFKRRLGWLLAIGVLHVVLLWYGDILVFYALFGFLMLLFRKKSNKSLLIWAGCILLLPVLFSTLLVVFIKLALSVPEVAEDMLAGFEATAIHMQQLFDHLIEVYATGSFGEIVSARLEEYKNILGGILFFFPNVLAMFLVGMVFARIRVFEDIEANKPFFRKLLIYSLPAALFGCWLYATYAAQSSYIMFEWSLVLTIAGLGFGGPAMTFVYISLIAFCYQKSYFKTLSKAIQKTGRMALTNYLMQSVVATTIFFSYGLGLYGQVDIVQGMILVTGIYVVQVIWSHFWLKHYRFGPMEWLWRTLTYGKKQKMKL
ncbi:MAG: DUF418 domain-containing protein [Bacteroidetes bacterium]|nr:MAG: DUF418 domain-containing protein [Bacteroidota bacterium]